MIARELFSLCNNCIHKNDFYLKFTHQLCKYLPTYLPPISSYAKIFLPIWRLLTSSVCRWYNCGHCYLFFIKFNLGNKKPFTINIDKIQSTEEISWYSCCIETGIESKYCGKYILATMESRIWRLNWTQMEPWRSTIMLYSHIPFNMLLILTRSNSSARIFLRQKKVFRLIFNINSKGSCQQLTH